LTHCIGAVLSVIAVVLMVVKWINHLNSWYQVPSIVFGDGLILLYSSSTLYHWIDVSAEVTLHLRKIDHIMIFVLIAATYTPICLVSMRGLWGWGIFAAVWSITLLGIFFKIFWISAPRWLSISLYVFMGWIAIFAIKPMLANLSAQALFWIVAGGISYSIGAIFYALKRPLICDGFGSHEIFHVFVMLGSAAHFWAIYKYI